MSQLLFHRLQGKIKQNSVALIPMKIRGASYGDENGELIFVVNCGEFYTDYICILDIFSKVSPNQDICKKLISQKWGGLDLATNLPKFQNAISP